MSKFAQWVEQWATDNMPVGSKYADLAELCGVQHESLERIKGRMVSAAEYVDKHAQTENDRLYANAMRVWAQDANRTVCQAGNFRGKYTPRED